MLVSLRQKMLPPSQRRTLEELTAELDLRHGDRAAKLSSFWTMLTLSGVIASAGILNDSTATVIGAMIIAPLSTPIMGIAMGIAKQERNASLVYVVGGGVLVIVVGFLFSLLLPGGTDVLVNEQVSSRTSPSLLDLVAALATGLAGAVALARRDVGAVLPGVAISISLVPPLAVVGVCIGETELEAALGALLLFLSNILALMMAGVLMFGLLGYTTEALKRRRASRRPYVVLTALMVVVSLPLVANSVATYLLDSWTNQIRAEAEAWVKDSPGSEVTDVDLSLGSIRVKVRQVSRLPPQEDLLKRLEPVAPDSMDVTLETTNGREIDLGPVAGTKAEGEARLGSD